MPAPGYALIEVRGPKRAASDSSVVSQPGRDGRSELERVRQWEWESGVAL